MQNTKENQILNIEKYKVSAESSIRDAVKKMDDEDMFFCACVDDDEKVIGVITDGDFRRAVHEGIQLDENVTKIINENFIYVKKGYVKAEIEKIFEESIVRRVPVLDKGRLLDIVTIEGFYGIDAHMARRKLDNPVIIMAGGKGTRLDPFTRILPKPLVPLGDEPVIKVIMDEFYKFGMNNFYISLNEKERMVRAYFHDHELDYKIKYVHEKNPLGTAGALKHLEGDIGEAFFVSNCDIIIRADYGAFYDFHKEGSHAITIVGSMQHHVIPYGVCEADNEGILQSIQEKPHHDFLVSTGMYLLEPELLKFIPENETYNMTDLIRKVKDNGLKVGIFPVSEKSWVDVGQLSEYKSALDKLM